MTELETIENLCDAANILLRLVKKQNIIIQQSDVPDELKKKTGAEIEDAEKHMAALERRIEHR